MRRRRTSPISPAHSASIPKASSTRSAPSTTLPTRGTIPRSAAAPSPTAGSGRATPTGHRTPNLGSLREPPFWGLPLKLLGTGIYSTGLLINSHAQVLREDRSAIDGLYATGNAAAYVEQPAYVGGLANARAITYAYLAATHAASRADG